MNKKRNTFIVFETLLREHSEAFLENNTNKYKIVDAIVKKFFNPNTELGKEIKIFLEILDYKNNYSNKTVHTTQMVFEAAKNLYRKLNKKNIFNEQTKLIEEINEKLGKKVFSNFLPEYKELMNLYTYVNDTMTIAESVYYNKNSFIESISNEDDRDEQLKYVDNIVFSKLIEKYNVKYSNLLPSQKVLIEKYITSYGDNIADFIIYINEEISRLKKSINHESISKYFEDKGLIKQKITAIHEKLDQFKTTKNLSTNKIEIILKAQQLAEEISNEN
jgi:hypothetical protein